MAETLLFQERRGGARKGAGRKQGFTNIKTRALADKLAIEGETLLEKAVNCVKQWYEKNENEKAFAASIPLLPYLHPRLAAMAIQTTKTELTLSELIEQSFKPQLSSEKQDQITLDVSPVKIEQIEDLL